MLSRGRSSRPSRCVRVRTMPCVSTRDRRAMAPLRVCRSGRVGEKQELDIGKLVKQRPSLALRLAAAPVSRTTNRAPFEAEQRGGNLNGPVVPARIVRVHLEQGIPVI